MNTLLDHIRALYGAGATEMTVHPDGSITARFEKWVRAEERRQLDAVLEQKKADEFTAEYERKKRAVMNQSLAHCAHAPDVHCAICKGASL